MPAQKIKVPYYRMMPLAEILANGTKQQAWCTQISLPARHGKKATTGESRAHKITLTIIGTQALCTEIANLNTADLAAYTTSSLHTDMIM